MRGSLRRGSRRAEQGALASTPGVGGRQRPLPQSHRTVGGTALGSLPRVLGQHGHPRPGTAGRAPGASLPPGRVLQDTVRPQEGQPITLTTFSWSQACPH